MQNLNIITRRLYLRGKSVLANERGEWYIDSAIKVLIVVVVGIILLTAIIAIFNSVIFPKLTTKISSMFDTVPTYSPSFYSP